MHKMGITAVALSVALSSGLAAEVPDLTDSMEAMCNPAYSRWPNSGISRHVQDLFPYNGKIYTSGGEWGNNTGPCPCFAVDPVSGACTNEFDAGTDAIYEFKEFSDGRLYASAVDIHEGAANAGSTFRRELDGQWRAYNTACTSCNITNFGSNAWQGYKIHNWDMVEYKGHVFVCGYGISGSTNWCEKAMFDATPQLRDMNRHMGPVSYVQNGYSFKESNHWSYRRFCAFLPFDDDLYCVPTQSSVSGDIGYFEDWEEWRWDADANRFVCQTNTWSGFAPDLTAESASFTFPSNAIADVQIWHPTKFGSRVLYVVGEHAYNILPWAAYSAVSDSHHVKATKIDLGGDDVKPFDICVSDGAAYIVAAQAGLTATAVTNSVWKSTDGVSFTKLFTFVSTRQASAICRMDGYFYLGMGSNGFTRKGWPKIAGTDISGSIYRVRDPSGGVEGGDGHDLAMRTVFAPSATALAKIGATAWADFPVLLRLPAAVSSQLRSVRGIDLMVLDETGAELPFEVETFAPAGTTLVWTKVPSLSAGTKLTVCFGGASNTNNDPTAVWSRYAVVIHGGNSIANAVGNGLSATGGSASVAASADAGKVGGGIRKSANNTIGVNVANPSAKLSDDGKFTISAWFKRDGNGGNNSNGTHVLGASRAGWSDTDGFVWLQEKGQYVSVAAKGSHQWSSGTGALPDQDWCHAAFAYDHGVSLTSYLDGAPDQTKSGPGNLKSTATYWTFGSYMNKASTDSFKGDIDEIRVFDGLASDGWLSLEYATMADDGFFSIGEIVSLKGVVPSPTFGGEGVPAPAFGTDASGAQVFTFAIGNAVKGAKYRIYKTESLTTPFEPYGVAIEATADGLLDFAVPTADEPSCFFKIVTE